MSELYPQIEAYLDNEMNPEERKAFEEACVSDPKLAEELAFYLQAKEASARLTQAHRKLAFINRYQNKAYELSIPKTWMFAAAAMIVLLIGSYWAITQFQSSPSLEGLLAHHLAPGKLPPAPGSRDLDESPIQSEWAAAKASYSAGNYVESLALCRQLENKLSSTEESDLYLLWGISALKTGENLEAAKVLKKVFAVLLYKQEAIWFESLAYLKAQEYEQAKKALNKIATNPDHYRHRQAAELLELID